MRSGEEVNRLLALLAIGGYNERSEKTGTETAKLHLEPVKECIAVVGSVGTYRVVLSGRDDRGAIHAIWNTKSDQAALESLCDSKSYIR